MNAVAIERLAFDGGGVHRLLAHQLDGKALSFVVAQMFGGADRNAGALGEERFRPPKLAFIPCEVRPFGLPPIPIHDRYVANMSIKKQIQYDRQTRALSISVHHSEIARWA